MSDHAPQSGDSSIPISVGSATGMAARLVASIAKEFGYPQLEQILPKLPEVLGKKIADGIKKLRANRPEGAPVLPEEKQAVVEAAILDTPEEAKQALGLMLGAAMDGAVDAQLERDGLLSSYAAVLNLVANIAIELQTSLALRGFVHRDDCVSYWHFKHSFSKAPWQRSGDYIRSSMDVYLLERDPSDDELNELNDMIRRSPSRQLSEDLFDHQKSNCISKVTAVYELKVGFEWLGEDPKPDPLFGETRASNYTTQFPSGAPAVATMLASLFVALAKQSEHKKKWAETLAQAEEIRVSLLPEIK
jgi:hypothetical protein